MSLPSEPQGDVVKEKAKLRPTVSSYWTSYLLHKQSLNFVLQDFDWLHIRRLEAARKEEFERKLKKREDRLKSEFYAFLQNSDVDEEHPLYGEFISADDTSDLDAPSISMESEEMKLKRLIAIMRKEYCWICDGLCSLFQRKSQRYYDYQNRHFIRSLRALRRESLAEPLTSQLVTEEEIKELYGNTLRVETFLRNYKIPKISRANSESTESDCYSTNSEEMDFEHTLDDFPSIKLPKKKATVSRPKRNSKFDYKDKFNSDDESDFESDFSTGTDSGISETFENFGRQNVDKCPEENSTDFGLQDMTNSFAVSDREDILSLFPEDEDIRLPKW